MSSYPITLGATLDSKDNGKKSSGSSSFISVKYNFLPPSIVKSSSGYLSSSNKSSNSQWTLEYDMRQREQDRRGSRSSAQGFQGTQTASKEYDCILVWDGITKSYVLDRLSSTFSFKYDRGHSKLSDEAKEVLDGRTTTTGEMTPVAETSALGLELASPAKENVNIESKKKEESSEIDEDEEEFARQLELGLEEFDTDEQGKESSMEESPPQAKTGLGLLEGNGLREDVITPRGSPYIDRPKSHWETTKSNLGPGRTLVSNQVNSTARSTPVVSPSSITNSPRPTGLDSVLSASSTWKPPTQRSNVAIAYDEDEEEESEDEDDEDDEEEEEDDDDDLDAYARQLESSLQG